jgi:hypothetical protein
VGLFRHRTAASRSRPRSSDRGPTI